MSSNLCVCHQGDAVPAVHDREVSHFQYRHMAHYYHPIPPQFVRLLNTDAFDPRIGTYTGLLAGKLEESPPPRTCVKSFVMNQALSHSLNSSRRISGAGAFQRIYRIAVRQSGVDFVVCSVTDVPRAARRIG